MTSTTFSRRSAETLNEINKAFLRAKELVQRILVFSRRQESERKPVALAGIVTEAATLLKATIPRRVEVRVRCASDLPMISADASQLHQVVMNLGTNAAHAMAEQGGVLAIEVDRVRIDARNIPSVELAPGYYVQLMVRDTGTGIKPDIIDRIFDPFFTTKGHGGTGLGLAVVDGIVRDHHGAITVECELGRGTTFRLLFPEAGATSGMTTPIKPLPVRGSGQCIMYVDDEESLVFVMPRLLKSIGYRCTGFVDPHIALGAFRADPDAFDAVIADLNMSKMSGLALLKALTAIRADLPVAIISGEGSDDVTLATEGVRARVNKPATLHELASVLNELVRR
jgi:CheY-like chemotaxis protein